MDYGAALTAIEASELPDKPQVVSAIKSHISSLIQEKRNVTAKVAQFTDAVETLSDVVGGVAGDDTIAKFGEAIKAVTKIRDDMRSAKSAAEASDAKVGELSQKLTALGRDAILAKVSALNGCNLVVLSTVLGSTKTEDIAVDGDKVTIGGVAYSDWLKTPAVEPFAPILVKAEQSKEPVLPETGKGSTGGQKSTTTQLPNSPATGKTEPLNLYDITLPPRALPIGHTPKP